MIDENGRYVGAPYNFVPLARKVISYSADALPAQDSTDKALYTGEVVYSVTAVSPIMIDGGDGHFFKNVYGADSIPGSTMRGLVRSNAQILSCSCVSDDIDDYMLMYRNVANGAEKDRYDAVLGNDQIPITVGNKTQKISVLTNVKAGYIKNEKGKYYIYDTMPSGGSHKSMNYYVLSERTIASDYIKSKTQSGYKFSYPFAFKDGTAREVPDNCRLQHLFWKGFKPQPRKEKIAYIGTENAGEYKPYSVPCSYEIANDKVVALGDSGIYRLQGYAVSTGAMKEKKTIYIMADPDYSSEPILIPDKDIKAFRIDFKHREKTLKSHGGKECFDLPGEGKSRPVFYIEEGGRLYFGFTPRLRLFYDHSVKEGVPNEHKNSKLDFAKALFGYSDSNSSLKTRISFSDAIKQTNVAYLPQRKVVLGEPKATSYMDYIVPDNGEPVTYNAQDFEIRGIKQYWLRDKSLYDMPEQMGLKENVCSKLNPLPAGTVFRGKVRFKNLKKEELGLLIWSLRGEKNSELNIGKAKAFGLGRIKISVDAVNQLDCDLAYNLESFSIETMKAIDPDEMVRYYQDAVKKMLNGRDIKKEPSVKIFIHMKDPLKKPEDEKIEFMKLGDYQSRTTPLELAEELFVWRKSETPVALDKGESYVGIVTKTEGKNIKFKLEDFDSVYDKIPCENITFKSISKGELKEAFPVGCLIRVEYCGKSEEKDIWKCTGKL